MSKTATLLISRQPLRPTSRAAWVAQAKKAAHWLKDNDYTLCSSVGIQTWELITSLGSILGIRQLIYLNADNEAEFTDLSAQVQQQFDLDPHLTEFIPVFSERKLQSKVDRLAARDRAIISGSDLVLPISLRASSGLTGLLENRPSSAINRDFQVPYEGRSEPIAYGIFEADLNPELSDLDDGYITHFTRAFNSAWPTERPIDFYRDILKSTTYPRCALDSLLNIVATERIIASANHMPRKEPTVSFSALPPARLIAMIRWRARYSRMSFEPYGIGIATGVAREMSILPVVYHDGADNGGDTDDVYWRRQSRGRITDWETEKEYRHLGDFDITGVPKESLILFCHTGKEADLIEQKTGLRTIPFVK